MPETLSAKHHFVEPSGKLVTRVSMQPALSPRKARPFIGMVVSGFNWVGNYITNVTT